MRWHVLLAIIAAVAVVVGAEAARAAGYFNMPGTFMQRAGHGYGAGYHAPLILGPISFDGWHMRNEVRLPCAPRASCTCVECGGCGQLVDRPSMMEGVVPTSAPESVENRAPTPAVGRNAPSSTDAAPKAESTRPIFDPPVQP